MATTTDMKGNVVKMEIDYSETVDKRIPECEALASDGKLNEALEILLALEKQTRTAADMHSTSRVLVCIVQLCFKNKDWNALNEHIVILTKRRSQLKQAVTKMIQEAFTYVEQTPDLETKLKLIDTLRTVTAGKIYVEIERARLTRMLAKIKEDQGDIAEAANILQELQVETYGSMEKREKVEFILEQMRLCLAKKDYIRTQIISKKISPKFFENNQEQDLKLKFYQLMIEVARHEGSYLDICKYYRAMFETQSVLEDKDQSDHIHRFGEEKTLEGNITLQVYRKKLTGQLFDMEKKLTGSARCVHFRTPTPILPAICIRELQSLPSLIPRNPTLMRRVRKLRTPKNPSPMWKTSTALITKNSPFMTSSFFAVTYEIVENSSKRGRPKLIDSQGYSYTLQRRRVLVNDWQCSIRPKVNPCRATFRQRGDQFQCGNRVHNHQAQVGALTAAKFTALVKVKAVEDIFKPAPAIVDEVLLKKRTDVPCPAVPNPKLIARQANRHRQRLRPAEPTDLDFSIEEQHLPEAFLKKT